MKLEMAVATTTFSTDHKVTTTTTLGRRESSSADRWSRTLPITPKSSVSSTTNFERQESCHSTDDRLFQTFANTPKSSASSFKYSTPKRRTSDRSNRSSHDNACVVNHLQSSASLDKDKHYSSTNKAAGPGADSRDSTLTKSNPSIRGASKGVGLQISSSTLYEENDSKSSESKRLRDNRNNNTAKGEIKYSNRRSQTYESQSASYLDKNVIPKSFSDNQNKSSNNPCRQLFDNQLDNDGNVVTPSSSQTRPPISSASRRGGTRETPLDFPPMPKSKSKSSSAEATGKRSEKSSTQQRQKRQNQQSHQHSSDHAAAATSSTPLQSARSMPGLNDLNTPPGRRHKSADRGTFKKESKSCNFLFFFRRKKTRREDRSPSPEARENHPPPQSHHRHRHRQHRSHSHEKEVNEEDTHQQPRYHRNKQSHHQHRSRGSAEHSSRDRRQRSSSRDERERLRAARSVSSFAELPLHPSLQPVVTPSRPVITPSKPVVIPSKPVVTPSRSEVKPSRPEVTPSRPVVTPSRSRARAEDSGRRSPSPPPPNGRSERLYIPNQSRSRADTTTTRETGCETRSSSRGAPPTPVSRTHSEEERVVRNSVSASPHSSKRQLVQTSSTPIDIPRKNSHAETPVSFNQSANARSSGHYRSASNFFDSVGATSGSGLNWREKSFPTDLDRSEHTVNRQLSKSERANSKPDLGSPPAFRSQPDVSVAKSESSDASSEQDDFTGVGPYLGQSERSTSRPDLGGKSDRSASRPDLREKSERSASRPDVRHSAHSASRTDLEEESHCQVTISNNEFNRRETRSHSLPNFGERLQQKQLQQLDTRVINDAEDFVCKPSTDIMRGPLNLSLCGCGFLGMYHLGVVTCLSQRGPSLMERVEKVGGASAGALMAAVMVTAPDRLEDCGEHIHSLSKEIRRKPLGALTPGYTFTRSMRHMLLDILPDNAHHLARDKLFVSLTNATTKKNELLTDFKSKEELVEALVASSFIPVYAGLKLPIVRGQKYYDGGMSDNLPKFESGRTITVSPFDGKTDISPKRGQETEKKAHFINVHNQDIQVSLKNIKRGAHAFFPPRRGVLQDYFDKGRYDAGRFLIREGLYEINYQQQSKSVLYESSV